MSDISNEPSGRDYFMSNTTYDRLKTLVQLGLPALGTLYFTLAAIWGLPYAEQVVGTIAAITTFLGVVLRFSTKSYDNSESKYDGAMHVEQTDEGDLKYTLALNDDPVALYEKSEIKFKVDGL